MKPIIFLAVALALQPLTSIAQSADEICSDPDSLLDNIIIERSNNESASEFKIKSGKLRYSGADVLTGRCAPLVSNARGSAYTFETGVYIRPDTNGSAYRGIKLTDTTVTTRPSQIGKPASGDKLLQEREIYRDKSGSSIFLGLLRTNGGHKIISFHKDPDTGSPIDIESLAETNVEIKSIDWIRFHHSNGGKVFVLTATSPPLIILSNTRPPTQNLRTNA